VGDGKKYHLMCRSSGSRVITNWFFELHPLTPEDSGGQRRLQIQTVKVQGRLKKNIGSSPTTIGGFSRWMSRAGSFRAARNTPAGIDGVCQKGVPSPARAGK